MAVTRLVSGYRFSRNHGCDSSRAHRGAPWERLWVPDAVRRLRRRTRDRGEKARLSLRAPPPPARRPACCLPPAPAVGKPVLLPVGWAPARPCQTPERPAGEPWPRRGARLPTHCRDGRRAGAGPNQAEASGKRKSCAGAREPGLLPARDKAREARRCPGGHCQCVSLECGLTPKALRSDEAERPALGAAHRLITHQGVSLGCVQPCH